MMPYINVHAYILYITLFYPKICLLNVNEEERRGWREKTIVYSRHWFTVRPLKMRFHTNYAIQLIRKQIPMKKKK